MELSLISLLLIATMSFSAFGTAQETLVGEEEETTLEPNETKVEEFLPEGYYLSKVKSYLMQRL